MPQTYTQLRQLTAQETGLFWRTGTVDATGSSVSVLRDDALTIYGNDRLNGHHVLLVSGSPSATELSIKDFFQIDGDARFEPDLATPPHSLDYEILPFSGTDFLRAIQDAIYESYDRGWLVRNHWSRMMGGSPLYNADFGYWSVSTIPDGWVATTTTATRERASGNLALSETSVALGTAAGYIAPVAAWKRYLADLKGSTLTFYCWVRTATASNARLNLFNGTNNYSSYHGGTNDWELLHVTVATAETNTDLEPRLYIDATATAYFNMPFVLGGPRVREYPFTIATMPDGPNEILVARMDISESAIAAGRGLGSVRQLSRQRHAVDYRVVHYHDQNAATSFGLLDFSASRRPPADGLLLWLRGDGPLTVPTSALSTDNLEITATEALLLAKVAAKNLLERGALSGGVSGRRSYGARIAELREAIAALATGAGNTRDTATYSLGW